MGAGPAIPTGGGPTGGGASFGGGAPPPKTFRGATAKSFLKLDWEYPVYTLPAEERSDRSTAKRVRKALSREEALAFIAGDDPRPLLVLRECKVCNGTDDALLKGGVENEKTFLLSSWFHCVKLPADVMEEDHPFHNLFTQEKPEHLFVCSVDGSNHDALESQTSRTELWDSMRKLLGKEYKAKPDSSIKKIARLLDKMDACDGRWNELVARRDDILEKDGPKSKKLKKIQKELDELNSDREELREEAVKVSERMKLKKPKVAKPEDAEEKPAAGI